MSTTQEALAALNIKHIFIALDRVIEAYASSHGPFHNPITSDAQLAVRELKSFLANIKQTAPAAARANPWRAAVDDALVQSGLDCLGPDDTPAEAIKRLVDWSVQIALDPLVSDRTPQAQAEVRAMTAGGNAGIATRIVDLTEGLPAGTKLYTHRAPADTVGAQERAEVRGLTPEHERYVWLRDHWIEVRACSPNPGRTPGVNVICEDNDGIGEGGERLDRAIDAARGITPPAATTTSAQGEKGGA